MSRISGWMTIVSHLSLSLLRILSIVQVNFAAVDCMSRPDPPTFLTDTLLDSGSDFTCLDSIRTPQGARNRTMHIVYFVLSYCLGHASPPTISELDMAYS